MPKSPDDLEGLKAERAAADRAYNDALTRLDAAIQAFPQKFPASPPGPDVQQLPSLNTRWKLTAPAPEPGIGGRFAAAVRRIVAPLFEQQEAFNGALVDHLNRNAPVQQASGEAIDAGLTVLREHIANLARFQTLLIVFLQQITPYVDTRDRDVAGLLRGLSGGSTLCRMSCSSARKRCWRATISTSAACLTCRRSSRTFARGWPSYRTASRLNDRPRRRAVDNRLRMVT